MGFIETEVADAIATLTINRPEAQNALNRQVLTELRAAVQDLGKQGVRVLVITGAGSKSFCAGADIAVMKDMSPEEAEEFGRAGHETMNAVAGSDMLSIAAINGYALGGGLELALSCDIRIASSNAKMGLPEVTLGLIPGFGGTQRLPRIVGRGHANEIILSGDIIDAARAERIGLVTHIFNPSELAAKAKDLARRFIAGKGPGAQKMARWMIASGLDLPLSAGLEREINTFAELFAGKEPREGMGAFLEKRTPVF